MTTTGGPLADYVDRSTLAQQLRCSERTLARYECQADGLPSTTIAGRKYYRMRAVLDWVASREQRPNPRRTSGAPARDRSKAGA